MTEKTSPHLNGELSESGPNRPNGAAGYNDMVFATAHYFDDRDPSAETEAWQDWLAGQG
jgi:hypothetical protein